MAWWSEHDIPIEAVWSILRNILKDLIDFAYRFDGLVTREAPIFHLFSFHIFERNGTHFSFFFKFDNLQPCNLFAVLSEIVSRGLTFFSSSIKGLSWPTFATMVTAIADKALVYVVKKPVTALTQKGVDYTAKRLASSLLGNAA